MFEFLKKGLQDAMTVEDTNDNNDDQVIEEFAHIIPELSEITMEGTMPMMANTINIDLDDDDEILSSIELSLSSGRILDIPADASIKAESYVGMYSFDDFYQEACSRIEVPFGDPLSIVNAKRHEAATKAFTEYQNYIIQEGLFGANKVDINDASIVWNVNVSLGDGVKTVLPVNYLVKPGSNKILVKQRDSAIILFSESANDLWRKSADYLKSKLAQLNIDIPKGKTLWDVVKAVRVLIPIEPVTEFCAFIEFENTMSKTKENDYIYYGYTLPIKLNGSKNLKNEDKNEEKSTENFDTSKFKEVKKSTLKEVDKTKGVRFMTPQGIIKEYSLELPSRPVPFIQEAIEFDTNQDPNPPGDDTAPADNGGDTNPPSNEDTGAATENPSTEVSSNDVSQEIEAGIKDNTNPDDPEDVGTNQLDPVSDIPDDLSGDEVDADINDLGSDQLTDDTDESSETPDADEQLAALDDMGEATEGEIESNDITADDVDKMSIEDMLASAQEKLKTMPMDKLKSFLTEQDTSAIQEAFILTKKNINEELDVALRLTLGTLNDSKNDINSIIKDFKKNGKRLNRALSKANKMIDVYSEAERKHFVKLNKNVADLLITLKPATDKSTMGVIKRLIKAFTSEAVVVGDIIKKHSKQETKKKNINESFSFLLGDE